MNTELHRQNSCTTKRIGVPIAQLELKPAAALVHRSDARVRVLFSGRRFGKTRLMLTEALSTALEQPGSQIFYLAPSRKMAKDIAWNDLKQMVPTSWTDRAMESTLTLEFRNGSRITLAGADYADSLRGQKAHLLLLDEFSYVSDLQSMWEASLLPMLGTTNGRVLFCSTPAGGGNFSAELWERAKSTPGWERWSFRSTDGGWISPEFVEEAKATMDPSLFRQEFEASIESLLGAIYPDFSRSTNVAAQTYDPNEPLLMGCDFNRNPMCACIGQLQGEKLVILREFVLLDADTRMLAQKVRDAFPRQEIICFPDPTGSRSQTSSMGLSDHAILRQHGFKVKSPRAPWAIRDKYAAVRLFIRDAQNRRRLKIDPSGKRLIRSLASLEYALGKAVADPKSDHGHMSDALGYLCLGIAKGLLPYSLGTTSFQMY